MVVSIANLVYLKEITIRMRCYLHLSLPHQEKAAFAAVTNEDLRP
jgi:hypothetical protein